VTVFEDVALPHQEVGNGHGRVGDGSIVGIPSSQQTDSHTHNHTGQEGKGGTLQSSFINDHSTTSLYSYSLQWPTNFTKCYLCMLDASQEQ